MRHVSRDSTFTEFSAELEPAAEADPREWLLVEIRDCFGGYTRRGVPRDGVPPGLVNPATGPIYVRDVQPGDVIRITIADISPGPQGFMGNADDLRFIPVADGFAPLSGWTSPHSRNSAWSAISTRRCAYLRTLCTLQ